MFPYSTPQTMSFVSELSSSNSSSTNFYFECTRSESSRILFTTYTFFNLLLLFPLYIFIFSLGVRRWRRRPSPASAGITMSHSDFFTYHMMMMEVFSVFGSVFYTLGTYVQKGMLVTMGVYTFSIIFPGQTLFHLLTCVDRYVAVVHPVTYLRLRVSYGVKVRNVSTAFAWLFSFSWLEVTRTFWPEFPTVAFLCLLGISFFVVFFCCLSVLCVLTRPGPGELGSGRRVRVDPLKQRAFYMIRYIMAALLLRFVGLLVCFSLNKLVAISLTEVCVLMDLGVWLSMPSSLVLPLLFLHRAGKQSCCRRSQDEKSGKQRAREGDTTSSQ